MDPMEDKLAATTKGAVTLEAQPPCQARMFVPWPTRPIQANRCDVQDLLHWLAFSHHVVVTGGRVSAPARSDLGQRCWVGSHAL